MYPAKDARELAILLQTSRELDTNALSSAWATMPLVPESAGQAAPPRPPSAESA